MTISPQQDALAMHVSIHSSKGILAPYRRKGLIKETMPTEGAKVRDMWHTQTKAMSYYGRDIFTLHAIAGSKQ